MGRVINLTLPYPPLTNNLYATVMIKGVPTRIPTDALKKFKSAVLTICIEQGVEPFVGEVAMTMKVFRPQNRGDLDGAFKAPIDGLKGSAYYDDDQITWFHAERFDDPKHPRVEVQIWSRGLF